MNRNVDEIKTDELRPNLDEPLRTGELKENIPVKFKGVEKEDYESYTPMQRYMISRWNGYTVAESDEYYGVKTDLPDDIEEQYRRGWKEEIFIYPDLCPSTGSGTGRVMRIIEARLRRQI